MSGDGTINKAAAARRVATLSDGGRRPARDSASSAGASPAADAWERHVLNEEELEIDPEELRDFLAADLFEVKADPVFKERLRQRLWRMVSLARTPARSTEPD